MKYTVYYQILSKKMKSTLKANSESEAVLKLKQSIVIHYIRETNCYDEKIIDPEVEKLKKMFGIK